MTKSPGGTPFARQLIGENCPIRWSARNAPSIKTVSEFELVNYRSDYVSRLDVLTISEVDPGKDAVDGRVDFNCLAASFNLNERFACAYRIPHALKPTAD